MDAGRNNLVSSDSLYLRQHSENPVHWQEWGPEARKLAAESRKPLFISVGYSSCHWCHVMASEAFTHERTARYLNDRFICVKVDREERPDIDHYLMEFLVQTTGSGGWPLNAFLTADLEPVFALTYAPAVPAKGHRSLLDVATRVHDYLEGGGNPEPFRPSPGPEPAFPPEAIPAVLARIYDREHGGFGNPHKFPPHSTLLYLLYRLSSGEDEQLNAMALPTLDAMRLGGLNDHLGGGIFRYCVDRKWTVPHFEKMLYDQAMALWCYSLAHGLYHRERDAAMARSICRCLERDFRQGDLYLSSMDADTGHEEGGTYLWEYAELEELLEPAEFHMLKQAYAISPGGNFEGRIHLVRRNDAPLEAAESKLLAARNARPQPGSDRKMLCGINALTVAGLLQASEHLGDPELRRSAAATMEEILRTFRHGGMLYRSLTNGNVQRHAFLFDASATLLALTMLWEIDERWAKPSTDMAEHIRGFRSENGWLESLSGDFHPVPAQWHDNPIPSGESLANLALARADILGGGKPGPVGYRHPHRCDFFNLGSMLRNGECQLLMPAEP